ncbi:MAG TPA: SDR family oxidoreductase [Gaiella sp.]
MTVLVTGATGTIGSGVVRELVDRGVPVRAFARSPEKAAGLGVEVAQGDFADPGSLRAALEGVERMFLCCGNVPGQLAYETDAIDAAADAGVRQLVKISTTGAEVDSPLAFWDWHGRIEQHLAASGVSSTVLRCSTFMSGVLAATDTVRHIGKLLVPAGDARISMIDPRDVAAVAATVLTEDGHQGETYALTGPAAITYAEIAATLSEVTGRDVEYVDVPVEAARAGMLEAGLPAYLVDFLTTLFPVLREGAAAETTDTVRTLTGSEPRSFAEWARDHAAAFGAVRAPSL